MNAQSSPRLPAYIGRSNENQLMEEYCSLTLISLQIVAHANIRMTCKELTQHCFQFHPYQGRKSCHVEVFPHSYSMVKASVISRNFLNNALEGSWIFILMVELCVFAGITSPVELPSKELAFVLSPLCLAAELKYQDASQSAESQGQGDDHSESVDQVLRGLDLRDMASHCLTCSPIVWLKKGGFLQFPQFSESLAIIWSIFFLFYFL